MSSRFWSELESLEQIIVKAVREALREQKVSSEIFNELINEGRIAAYETLWRRTHEGSEDGASIFPAVVRHVRKVLKNYLPLSKYSLDELQGFKVPALNGKLDEISLSPLAIAVLLSTTAPIERLYVLHELLGWEKPPRYCKARLKKRWQEINWVKFLTGHVKASERGELFSSLCQQAIKGEPREREIAGFALVCISDQISEGEKKLARETAQSLINSPEPVHQLAGLWILNNLQPNFWDNSWLIRLDINSLGAFLESQYVKPKNCLCPSPFCLHYYSPNSLSKSPPLEVISSLSTFLSQFSFALQNSPNWHARWRGRLMAKALGLYAQFQLQVILDFLPSSLNRTGQMLISVLLARLDPKIGLEHALEWLPKGPTVRERIFRALNSPEPIERSSALYVARGLAEDEMRSLLTIGFSDPLVFVRFAALRPMESGFAYDAMEQELLSPHEHKRLLHRCILNTMARADFERTLEIAKRIYLGQEKEMWREDAWLRHDAGYLLLEGFLKMNLFELLDVFQQIVTHELRPSPFVLLPALQALLQS
ncbi:MAG: hypothetical protein NZ805_15115 [Armatimonadetes bacterium]|nr:hypothetical protein [Armatimonadota bacterium]MDW8026895.1 hypothetical protein [Armatimonadota bacterium]